jgi:hypothetical protein
MLDKSKTAKSRLLEVQNKSTGFSAAEALLDVVGAT